MISYYDVFSKNIKITGGALPQILLHFFSSYEKKHSFQKNKGFTPNGMNNQRNIFIIMTSF